MFNAFKKYGQANKCNVMSALTPGKGPTIQNAPLSGAFGEFTPETSSDELLE